MVETQSLVKLETCFNTYFLLLLTKLPYKYCVSVFSYSATDFLSQVRNLQQAIESIDQLGIMELYKVRFNLDKRQLIVCTERKQIVHDTTINEMMKYSWLFANDSPGFHLTD